MSDDAKEWRWVGEDGVEKNVSEQELIAELSSEALANHTLVWRKGWAEWLPAMQVAELAWALPPGKADDPVRPKERAGAESPPAPPLYRYPVIKRRAQNLRADRPPPPRPPPVGVPRPGVARPPAKPPPKPPAPPGPPLAAPPIRMPAPSPAGAPPPEAPARPPPPPPPAASGPEEPVELDSDAATLEPVDEIVEVDAVLEESQPEHAPPEPPNLASFAATQAYGDESDEGETRVVPSKPPPPLHSSEPMYVAPHTPPPSESPASMRMPELPRIPPPPPPPKDLMAPEGPQTTTAGRPPMVYALAGLVTVVALAVVVLLVAGGDSEEEAPANGAESAATIASAPKRALAPSASAATTPASTTRAVPPPACEVKTAPQKLGDWAEVGVPPMLARVPGSARVAVGYAQSETYAVGITINPENLDKDQVFREFRKRGALSSVTPTATSGKLRFVVARNTDDLDPAIAVDGASPFLLGASDGVIRRAPAESKDSHAIWKDVEEPITTPRVASLVGGGYAVTFRSGGKSGGVLLGWLNPDGTERTGLSRIPSNKVFAGTPMVTENGQNVLVAFAARGESDDAWSIELARATPGESPSRAQLFELPAGGPGKNAISPVAAGYHKDRWLLQWTEGASGNRAVRLQLLGPDLSPENDAVTISLGDQNAGGGALWVEGNHVVSLFLVHRDKTHELWGATLTCPE